MEHLRPLTLCALALACTTAPEDHPSHSDSDSPHTAGDSDTGADSDQNADATTTSDSDTVDNPCTGLADNSPCTVPAFGAGLCVSEYCLPAPRVEVCGNGVLDPGELCDCGTDVGSLPASCAEPNSELADASCRTDCRLASCGDGVTDSGEQCDDGGYLNGDGCSTLCTLEVCGNGIVDAAPLDGSPGEECDDGNLLSRDGCSPTCRSFGVALERRLSGLHPVGSIRGMRAAYDAARGHVLEFGGYQSQNIFSDTFAQYAPDLWMELSSPTSELRPARRFGHAMAYDHARKVVVLFGGQSGGALADTWTFDGERWRDVTPLDTSSPPARVDHQMVYDAGRRRVVMFGGQAFSAHQATQPEWIDVESYDDLWEWDGTRWFEQLPTGSKPPARILFGMVYDPVRGRVVVHGGIFLTPTAYRNDTWAWDGSTWTDLTTANSLPQRWGIGLGYDPVRRHIVRAGGTLLPGLTSNEDPTWRLTDTTWSAGPAFPAADNAPFDTTLVFDFASDRLIGQSEDKLFLYDGSSWGEGTANVTHSGANADDIGRNVVATYDARRGRVVFMNEDVWEWDGEVFFQPPSGSGPPVTGNTLYAIGDATQNAMTYDWERGESVWAGSGETWEWNGTRWLESAAMPVPLDREGFSIAYDARRNETILFGGRGTPVATQTTLDDTWAYNGVSWQPLDPATSPPARYNHSMAFDAARGRIVLFGGQRDDNTLLGDIWEWNGVTWEPMTPAGASPGPRALASLVYDPFAQRVVVLGGLAPGALPDGPGISPYYDTWEWDGARWWPQVTPAPDNVSSHIGRFGAPGAYHNVVGKRIWSSGFSFEQYAAVGFFVTRYTDIGPQDCRTGLDGDRDGLVGCADPDCFGSCAPLCPPEAPCDPDAPHCGDGECNTWIESQRLCPEDCGLAEVCGDFLCEGVETQANCPGDCTT